MKSEDQDHFCPANARAWRRWLEKNHQVKDAVWLVYYKKSTGKRSLSWSEAVDEALCFGWIDSIAKSLDEERYQQFFTRRKRTSVWSKINKEKVAKLIGEGRMTHAGMESIEIAKQNGSWRILDSVEEGVIPRDLAKAFKTHPGSNKYFKSLSLSVRKGMLQWITLAKRPGTRAARVEAVVQAAAQKTKPTNFI